MSVARRTLAIGDVHGCLLELEELVTEAMGAERYSRRLADRISDGLAAKFEHHSDPAGQPG